MKLNIKGLVFVGFAAAVFASAANAADGDEKKVTSLKYTEATYQKKLSASAPVSVANDTVTVSNFTGPEGTTAGAAGLVPAPGTADAGKVLGANGWVTIDGTAYSSGNIRTITMGNDGHTITAVTEGGVGTDNTNLVTGGQVQTALDGKVTKNADITGATKTKITYDAKGLVTAGADLAATDIPRVAQGDLTTDQITGANITDDKFPTAKAVRKSIDLAISGQDMTGYEVKTNKAAAIVTDGSANDNKASTDKYASTKAVYDYTQAKLSGTSGQLVTYGATAGTVGSATLGTADLTITKGGQTYQTFNANATTGVTIDIPNAPDIPTPTSGTCTAEAPCALVWAGSAPTWQPIQQ